MVRKKRKFEEENRGPIAGTSKGSTISKNFRTPSKLDQLPLDVLLEIFRRLPMKDIAALKHETTLLNEAVRQYFKYSLVGLRKSNEETVKFLCHQLNNLSVSEDRSRMEIVNSISTSRYLATEIELLFATVWRLRLNPSVWSELIPNLVPVLEEFDRVVNAQKCLGTLKTPFISMQMAQTLPEWFGFLSRLDSGLDAHLRETSKTPFEIRVIDLLMCAPSINFQLGFSRVVDGDPTYDVYGFFKTTNLKQIGQVPDVFNAHLNIEQKKSILITYLRETVQWENFKFLMSQISPILNLEWLLVSPWETPSTNLCRQLNDSYSKIGFTPYNDLDVKYIYRPETGVHEEFYSRCFDENLSYTCLYIVVLVPSQVVVNLPLVLPFLRGRRRRLNDFYGRTASEHSADLSNVFLPFRKDEGKIGKAQFVGSECKPKFQLVVHFRESLGMEPSEVVVNVGYDEGNKCYLTFHNLKGGPFVSTATTSRSSDE